MSTEPENLIHRKLNKILAWMDVRGKQLDAMSEDIKSIKGAVWANELDAEEDR